AEAAQSAADAKDALDEVRDLANQTEQWKENAKGYYEQIDSIIPTVSASKDPTTGIIHINVTSLGNSADTYIKDGTQIDVEHEYDNGVHTVTMKDAVTEAVLTQFDIVEPQGSGLGDMLASEFVGSNATKRVNAADNLWDGSKLVSASDVASVLGDKADISSVYTKADVDSKFDEQIDSGFLQSRNVWDEIWEAGTIDTASGAKGAGSGDRIRTANFIEVKPSAEYYLKFVNSGNIGLCYYDSNKRFISGSWVATNTTITIPSNAKYIMFVFNPSYGTTYHYDACINESDSQNGIYTKSNGKSNRELTEETTGIKNNLKWKLLQKLTGISVIPLTNIDFEELLVKVSRGTSGVKVSFHLCKEELTVSNEIYVAGGAYSTNNTQVGIYASLSNISLQAVYEGSNNLVNTSTIEVYYR
ncbi:MAG: hypothetical protein MJ093_09540, partial [Saccharofermentans sp.]|nr:hypothetical protein [Saccharofermentans sp.]